MRKSAGELSLKASTDYTKYDPLEVGHALTDGFEENLIECAKKHEKIIDEDEFCIVFVLADDPVLKNVMRRKFYAWPFLPKPRPRQGCFLYNKIKQEFKRLWILPQAATMSYLSTLTYVSPPWQNMKNWSDAFYNGKFWEFIRDQHNIDLLSEKEYLDLHAKELIKSGCNVPDTRFTDPLDLEKIYTKEVVNANIPVSDQS